MRKLKILTIVGARPQIIKASAISRAIAEDFQNTIEEVIVHTGQHYDTNMSALFFDELQIPQPAFNLQIGSGTHAAQTAKMLIGIEELLLSEKADALLVYGDTNSTIAGALAASKLLIPVIHIEAGLRSFNKTMPEEINRIACDHVSTFLFCPTDAAITNLKREGFSFPFENGIPSISNPVVEKCGDIMYDNSSYFSSVSDEKSSLLAELGCENEPFFLVSMHRDSNTDDPIRLNAILTALTQIVEEHGVKLIFPIHPRTKKMIELSISEENKAHFLGNENILLIDPVGFLDVISLEKNARLILTDSGGLQKEAYFFQKPCVILREETEWIEIVETGNAILAGSETTRIVNATRDLLNRDTSNFPEIFGNGKAAHAILTTVLDKLK
jgi:UDP-GlcNAc3NAcA epimerase